jgi:hypothetical protein
MQKLLLDRMLNIILYDDGGIEPIENWKASRL